MYFNYNPMPAWAEEITALRKRAKLTQREAAAHCNIPLGSWRNYEQGRYKPSKATLVLIRLKLAR